MATLFGNAVKDSYPVVRNGVGILNVAASGSPIRRVRRFPTGAIIQRRMAGAGSRPCGQSDASATNIGRPGGRPEAPNLEEM